MKLFSFLPSFSFLTYCCFSCSAEESKPIELNFSATGLQKIDAEAQKIDKDTTIIVNGSRYVGGSSFFQLIENVKSDEQVPKSISFKFMEKFREASTYKQGNAIYVKVDAKPTTDPVLDLWIDFSLPVGKPAPLGLTLNNGLNLSMLGEYNGRKLRGSPYLKCVQSVKEGVMTYNVTWDGNDLDGDSQADSISFDLVIEGFSDTVLPENATEEKKATLGENLEVNLEDGRWGLGQDNDLDTSESLLFSLKNIVINAPDFSCTKKSFTKFAVTEIDGKSHRVVSGDKLKGTLISKTVSGSSVFNPNTEDSLFVSSKGSFDENGFQVRKLSLHLKVENPEVSLPSDPTDYTDTEEGIFYRGSYSEQKKGVDFPDFSWERIPLWLAVRTSKKFSEDELQTIANNYSLVFLEKQTRYGFEFNDEGIFLAAKELKNVNPNLKISAYWNSSMLYGRYTFAKDFGDDFGDDDWYLDKMVRNRWPIFNLKNESLRKWWVKSALFLSANPNIDGVFIDAPRSFSPYFYDVEGKPTVEAHEMFHNLRESMESQKFLLCNGLQYHLPNANRQLLECFDGVHTESWDQGSRRSFTGTGKYDISDSARASIQYMQEANSKGKLVFMQATNIGNTRGQKKPPAEEVLFPLALYLMAVEENMFFSYNTGVAMNPENQQSITLSPKFIREFNRPLGKPKGAYTRVGDTYTREFEHLTVSVNTETQETIFQWAKDADGDGKEDEWELDEYGSVFENN